jgi:hypothetical protein
MMAPAQRQDANMAAFQPKVSKLILEPLLSELPFLGLFCALVCACRRTSGKWNGRPWEFDLRVGLRLGLRGVCVAQRKPNEALPGFSQIPIMRG